MTPDEHAARVPLPEHLSVGDLAVWLTHRTRPTVRVEEVGESTLPGIDAARVRRLGGRKDGRPHASFWLWPWQLARVSVGRANVYADWLEDHGEPRAAAKLREAFPLARED